MSDTPARNRLQAVIELGVAALGGVVTTVESVHGAVARQPFGALRLVPGVGGAAQGVRRVHDGVTRAVYAGIGGAIALAGGAARLAAAGSGSDAEEPPAASRRALALAALNGFAGHRLAAQGSPLASGMTLRRAGRPLALERAALAAAYPNAAPRLAVFVHGLACNETLWRRHAARHYGDPEVTYGSRLEGELGHTALYVRYNTGLHISANGRQLAALLERLVAQWPVAVDELVLVGHSMGGLVVRSATHYGAELEWTRHVRHVVFLGSPHRGAPLEKLANAAAWGLGLTDVTRPFAALVDGRSDGIKDLRRGALRDEDWQGSGGEALLVDRTGGVPLLAGATHYFVAATVTRDRHHPLGTAIGDLLVRPASALPGAPSRHAQFRLAQAHHFGAMTHLDLLNHPAVYEQLRTWLREGKPKPQMNTDEHR